MARASEPEDGEAWRWCRECGWSGRTTLRQCYARAQHKDRGAKPWAGAQ